ncbi:hypothetical protein AWB81_07235 [Caballeronia arationis]|nr:hypothetical protein AWB81_07235 [Caballeronia arationis]
MIKLAKEFLFSLASFAHLLTGDVGRRDDLRNPFRRLGCNSHASLVCFRELSSKQRVLGVESVDIAAQKIQTILLSAKLR